MRGGPRPSRRRRPLGHPKSRGSPGTPEKISKSFQKVFDRHGKSFCTGQNRVTKSSRKTGISKSRATINSPSLPPNNNSPSISGSGASGFRPVSTLASPALFVHFLQPLGDRFRIAQKLFENFLRSFLMSSQTPLERTQGMVRKETP